MSQHRALLTLGVAASLVIAALALPRHSAAAPQESDDASFAPQGWTKINSNVELLSQDKDSVLIYSPYRNTLKIISKYHDVPIRVINVDKVPKTTGE